MMAPALHSKSDSSKVLCVTHISNFFGANRSLLSSLEVFNNQGLSPLVLCPQYGELTEVLEMHDFEFRVTPVPWWLGSAKAPAPALNFRRALRDAIREHQLQSPAFVYTNSIATPLGYLLARHFEVPHCWHVRELGKEDYNLDFKFRFSTILRALKRSHTVFNSQAVSDKFLGDSLPHSSVVFNCVGIPETVNPPQTEATRLGVIGHLHHQKGQLDLIKFWAEHQESLKGLSLSIIGAGDPTYSEKCRATVQELTLCQQISFVDYQANVEEILSTLDIVLIPSHCEAFGRVTAEAMAAGKVVIGKASCGTKELIEHEKTGLLYSTDQELLDALTQSRLSLALRQKLSAKARAYAQTTFSFAAFQKHLEQVLWTFLPRS